MGTSDRTSRKDIHLRDYFIVLDRYKWLIVAAVIVTLASTVLYLRRQEPVYEAQASIIIEPKRAQEMVFQQSVQAISLDLETQIEVIRMTPVLSLVVRQLELTAAPEGTLEFSEAVKGLRKNVKIGFVGGTKVVNISARHTVPETAQAIANAVAQSYIDQDRLSRLESGRDAVSWLSTQLADLKIKLKKSEEAFQQFKEREGMITLDEKRNEELQEMSKLNNSYLAARSSRMEIDAIVTRIEETKSEAEGLDIPLALLNTPTLQRLGTDLSQLQTELADKKKLFKDTYPAVVELRNRIRLTEEKILVELKRQRDFLQVQEDMFLTQQKAARKEALNLTRKEIDYLSLEREVTTNREMYNTLLSKVKELSLAGEADLNNIRIVEPAELPTTSAGNKKMTLVLGGFLGLFLGVGFAFFLKYLENTIRTPDDVEQHLNLPVLGVVPRVSEARESKTPLLLLKGNPKSAPAEAYRSIRTNILFSRIDSLTNRPIDQSTNRPIDQSTNRPIDQSTNRPIDQSTNRPIDQSTNRPIDQSTYRPTDQSTHPRTIVITSTGPKEGKTFTVANLGMALAQAGQKVLLVDADLRRPMLHRVFNVDRNKGLSTVLAGEITLDDAIIKYSPPETNTTDSSAHEPISPSAHKPISPSAHQPISLSILTSGSVPANPSEVLGSARMKELMYRVREQYDVVVLDSAPVLGMTDTAVLASECDTVAMVIKTGEATRKALKMAIAQLEQVGAKICGVVLNDVDIGRDRYYYYYYYYYYYSPYGDDEDRTSRRRKKRRRSSGRKTITKGPSPTRS